MARIVTWNVNSITIRLERLLAFLQRERPQVVCLQELKCEKERFPFEALRNAGYEALVFGQKAYNGVALLYAKDVTPPRDVVMGFEDGVDDPQSRFIGARFGDVSVYSLYVPNGQTVGSDKYFYKLNWLARLRRYLERAHAREDFLVLAGDYNVAPSDIDVHDPGAWREKLLCSTREREALQHVCGFGLIDAYRTLYPQETQFTWWDYRMLAFPKNHGLRIDLFLVSESLRSRLAACGVDRDERKGEKPSDHAPVLLDLRDVAL